MTDRPRRRRRATRTNAQNGTYTANVNNVKMRGTAHQIAAKCRELADETEGMIEKENFLQHAEHYQRLINDAKRPE